LTYWLVDEVAIEMISSIAGSSPDARTHSPVIRGDDDYVVLFAAYGYIVWHFKEEGSLIQGTKK